MRGRGLVLTTAAAVVATLAGAPPAGATACTPTIWSATASNAVITATGKAASRVTVRAADSCSNYYYYSPGVWGVSVTAYNPGRDVTTGSLTLSAGTPADGTWTGYLTFSSKDSIGTWYLDVTASDNDGQVSSVREASLRLRRNTRVSLDARPEPVDRGAALRVSGHMSKLTAKLVYLDFRDAVVRIYFRRVGSSTKVLVTRTRTDDDGRYSVAVSARRAGRWYAYYPGSFPNTSRWSPSDLVRVR